ncbi:hypothetical protein [Kitasatospora purpeofusca]|uniref:hypothetical protein n=1 Tax=Kitasatospora purpeofusca TaxID=67352 RepID=UPI00366231FC
MVSKYDVSEDDAKKMMAEGKEALIAQFALMDFDKDGFIERAPFVQMLVATGGAEELITELMEIEADANREVLFSLEDYKKRLGLE